MYCIYGLLVAVGISTVVCCMDVIYACMLYGRYPLLGVSGGSTVYRRPAFLSMKIMI